MKIISAKFVKGISGTDPILLEKKQKIAIVGRSNVGKSSLINSLVNRKGLAQSSSTPGKTQKLNFYLINDNYYFIDLPGYGFASVKPKAREKLGKLLVWFLTEESHKPEAVILVVDSNTGFSNLDLAMVDLLNEYKYNFFVVLNKSDKLNQKEKSKILKEAEERGVTYLLYSSKDNKMRDELLNKIFE
jgi:GTP-binding protein